MSQALTIGAAAAPDAASSATAAAGRPTRSADEKKAAEGFERMLVGQLTKQLVDSALPADSEASAVTGSYRQMLPDALTEALMSGGGIGLAQQLAASSGKASS
jgi:Rod binding domain-containing protein